MLPCTFIRIDDAIYNMNTIRSIDILETRGLDSDNGPLVEVMIMFSDYLDVSPKRFWTYYDEIGKFFYDWKHNKCSFFEIIVIGTREAQEMNRKYRDDLFDEMAEKCL